jgi:catechol 2,3-dioxygenase-like lactoylglutathione lyase family enzyme
MTALVTALQGITIACQEPAALESLFDEGLGWRRFAAGPVDDALARQWGIAPGSAGSRFSIYGPPGATRGMVRVVAGEDRVRSRPLAARWAGIEMVVASDIDALHARLASRPGFATLQEPVTMDWSEFGSNQHRAFIGRGPGGTHLSFTMALTRPIGREFPQASAPVGHVFELPLVTAHFERAHAFYCGTLGMTPILESAFDRGLWHEIWKLPQPAPVKLHLLKGDAPGTGLGAIELTGYDATLIDAAPAARDRLDGGTCLVTFTANDIEATFRAIAASKRATLLSEPHRLDGAPYAGARAFAFLGPDGERVEIVGAPWRA